MTDGETMVEVMAFSWVAVTGDRKHCHDACGGLLTYDSPRSECTLYLTRDGQSRRLYGNPPRRCAQCIEGERLASELRAVTKP